MKNKINKWGDKLSINVILIDMDTYIKEQIIKNADDSYTIFLNAKMNVEQQKRSYKHALYHIENDDFNRNDVNAIENNAHRRIHENNNSHRL